MSKCSARITDSAERTLSRRGAKTDVYFRVAAFAFLKDTVREWLDR